MPRMPQNKQYEHKHECERPGYLYIDAATEYKLALLSDKIDAIAKNPFTDIESTDQFDDNDYLLMEDINEGAKKVTGEDAAKILVINGGEIK